MQRCLVEAPPLLIQGRASKLSHVFVCRPSDPLDGFYITGGFFRVTDSLANPTFYYQTAATSVGKNVYFQIDLADEAIDSEHPLSQAGLFESEWEISTSFGDVIKGYTKLRVI